jgi:hypothetical protein
MRQWGPKKLTAFTGGTWASVVGIIGADGLACGSHCGWPGALRRKTLSNVGGKVGGGGGGAGIGIDDGCCDGGGGTRANRVVQKSFQGPGLKAPLLPVPLPWSFCFGWKLSIGENTQANYSRSYLCRLFLLLRLLSIPVDDLRCWWRSSLLLLLLLLPWLLQLLLVSLPQLLNVDNSLLQRYRTKLRRKRRLDQRSLANRADWAVLVDHVQTVRARLEGKED